MKYTCLIFVFFISIITSASKNTSGELYRKSPIKSVNPDTMSAETRELYKNWKELEKRNLSLLPVPKSLKFDTHPITLDKNCVIVLKDKTAKGKIAVNEINSMVREFSGGELAVRNTVQKNKYNIIIENIWPNFFTKREKGLVKTENSYCRNQAYMIEPVKEGVRLGGNSSIAVLYAAVTLRFLITGNETGNAVLHPALVVDWPDIPRRQLMNMMRWRLFCSVYKKRYNRPPTESEYIDYAKSVFDKALRFKINVLSQVVCRIMHFTVYNADKLIKNSKYIDLASKLKTYASERGISICENVSSRLGNTRKTGDENRPELQGCMTNCHGVYSWAKDDLHRRKAEKVARFCKLYNTGLLRFHVMDTGSVFDPQAWSQRDKFTREKFGDDLTSADLSVIKIYLNALKGSGVEMIAILYPYMPYSFDADSALKHHNLSKASKKYVEKSIEETINYQRNVIKGLPDGTPICLREGSRKLVRNQIDKIIKNNPLYYYLQPWESSLYGFVRVLPLTFSSISSIFYAKRNSNDIIYACTGYMNLPGVIPAAEYSWNCFFPGHSDLTEGKDYDFYSMRDPALEDIIAERVAVGLWGGTAGLELKETLKNDISLSIGFLPHSLRTEKKFKNFIPMLTKNQRALENAIKLMDATWKLLAASPVYEKNRIITTAKMPDFVKYRLFFKGASAWNYARLIHEKAITAIARGNINSVNDILENGLKKLNEFKLEWQNAQKEMSEEPIALSGNLISYELIKPDFPKMFKLLTDLKEKKEEIFRESIPSWYKEFMTQRPLPVSPVKNPPNIDGIIEDKAWEKACHVENFIGVKKNLLPNPVIMKLLYDNEYLYVGGQIINPQISKINIPKRKANLWKRGESIELFLCENSTVKTYCQFVLDVANNLFATGKTGNKKIAMERDRIKHKVAKYENSWTFEMRIPLTLIPNLNLKNATGIVCYNHDTLKMIYPYSSSWLVHKGFHWTKGYGPLNFLPVPNLEILKPDAVISLMNIKARNTVTAFGSGANVSFRINITSKKPLYSLTFNVKILDESGKELCKAMKIKPSREFIGPFFVSEKKHIQLPLEYKKIKIRIKAQFRTSDEKFHEKSFNQTIDVK